MEKWLAERGMPQITIVRTVDRKATVFPLKPSACAHTLPSIAYGYKRCSHKHKIASQEKFCNNYQPCREVWRQGEKIIRFIGYDAGELNRYERSRKYNETDKKYHSCYPDLFQ